MLDEDVEKAYNEMVEMFGDSLPNPEHYPKCFAYYVKLWKYYKSLKESESV